MIFLRNCSTCGNPFEAEHYLTLCCSEQCNKERKKKYFEKYHSERRKNYIIKCKTCGQDFKTTNSLRKYCDNCKKVPILKTAKCVENPLKQIIKRNYSVLPTARKRR